MAGASRATPRSATCTPSRWWTDVSGLATLGGIGFYRGRRLAESADEEHNGILAGMPHLYTDARTGASAYRSLAAGRRPCLDLLGGRDRAQARRRPVLHQ